MESEDPVESDDATIIRVENLEHAYGDFRAVDGISFSVKKGEIFSFLGPNGAGKSTAINVLITLLALQKGTRDNRRVQCHERSAESPGIDRHRLPGHHARPGHDCLGDARVPWQALYHAR